MYDGGHCVGNVLLDSPYIYLLYRYRLYRVVKNQSNIQCILYCFHVRVVKTTEFHILFVYKYIIENELIDLSQKYNNMHSKLKSRNFKK